MLRWPGQVGPTVNVMTDLYQAAVTDLIDRTFENIRCGTGSERRHPGMVSWPAFGTASSPVVLTSGI